MSNADASGLDEPAEPGVYRLQARTYSNKVIYYVAEEHPDRDRPFIVEFITCDPSEADQLEEELWGRFTRGEFRLEAAVA